MDLDETTGMRENAIMPTTRWTSPFSAGGLLLLSVLLVLSFSSRPARAQESALTPAAELPSTGRMPGVDLAEGISEITGVAISPLLGVSSVGAWRFFRTPDAERDTLPWFCHPYAWGTGFILLGMCLLKDVVGAGAPALLKKPLDFAELFEDKLSAAVATGAFVPWLTVEMGRAFSPAGPADASASSSGVSSAAVIPLDLAVLPFFFWILLVPLCMAVFLVVWLASHSINVLIALSPLGIVDAVLKLFKLALLSSVVAASMLSPFLGAALSLVIIGVAVCLAPWAFRLTVFGTLMGLDILLPGRGRRRAEPAMPHSFLARPMEGIPTRTFGRLTRSEDGSVRFVYRPWLVLPRQSVALPVREIALCTGIIYPSLARRADGDGRRHSTVLILLPRYRAHADEVAGHLAIADVRDSVLVKGFKAARSWFADTLSIGRAQFEQRRGPEAA